MIEDKQTQIEKAATQHNDDSCCSDTRCCAPPFPTVRSSPKIGRNDPCPCNSGRKHKKCCGQ